MNQDQLNQVKTLIDSFYNMDVDVIFSIVFKDQEDLNTVNVGRYSALDLIVTIKRVYDQFRNEFDEPESYFLPYQYQFQNEFGNGNLLNDINNVNNYLKNRQVGNIVPFIDRLVHYQKINGIWDKSRTNYIGESENKIRTASDSVTAIGKHLESLAAEAQQRFSKIDSKYEELSNFLTQKQSELSEISVLLEASRANSGEISETNNNVSAISERINGQYVSAKEKIEEISS